MRVNRRMSRKSGIWEANKRILAKLYNIISVFSTLTIFSGIIIFLFGQVINSNQSDNDLIMKQIKRETKDEEISSIFAEDIHNFGNTSIIVTSRDIKNGSNKLLVLDLIDNSILREMNNLFGLASNYKTTFSYALIEDDVHLMPETEYVLDIIGDATKEIIVKYYVYGSTYGANGTAIFKYSYKDEEYRIIGTYPTNEKMNISQHDERGNIISSKAMMIKTVFNEISEDEESPFSCYDGEREFNLNPGKWEGREYWIDSEALGKNLVTVNLDRFSGKDPYINIYQPIYDEEKGELLWNLIYSEYVKDFPYTYSQSDLENAVTKIVNFPVNLVQ